MRNHFFILVLIITVWTGSFSWKSWFSEFGLLLWNGSFIRETYHSPTSMKANKIMRLILCWNKIITYYYSITITILSKNTP